MDDCRRENIQQEEDALAWDGMGWEKMNLVLCKLNLRFQT